jgi:SP family arabinose:H+ symporter-like MFS transporter
MNSNKTRISTGLPEAKHGGYVFAIALLASLGGLLFGYDWVVISGADLFYEKYFDITSTAQIGWAKSCAIIGCLLGALVTGVLSDRLGRKKLLMVAAVLFTASAFGTALCTTYNAFVFWRILGGIGIGIASNLSPMYIAEAAPAKIRGRLVTMYQLAIVVGILAAQLANWLIAEPMLDDMTPAAILESWNGQYAWRWMFAAEGLPAVIFMVGLFFVPESPRWLIKNGQLDRAYKVLKRIGGKEYADFEHEDIQATLASETTNKVDFRELFDTRMKKTLMFGIILSFTLQWCGINVIFYYTKDIFLAAGFGVSDILLNIAIIGLANLIFTLVAIATVDRIGRRPLMLAGWVGLSAIYLLLGLTMNMGVLGIIPVVLVVAAISCYACTLAPVYWVLLSEIFPNRLRGTAMAIAVFVLWTGNFTLTYSFPIIVAWLGSAGTYWLYAAICGFGFYYSWKNMPETKGKTLEDIERELVD